MPLGQPNDAVAAASASTGRRSAFLPFYLRLHKRSVAQLFNCCCWRCMNESDVVVVIVVDSLNEFEFECGPCKRRTRPPATPLLPLFLTIFRTSTLLLFLVHSCLHFMSLSPSFYSLSYSFSLSLFLFLSLFFSLSFSVSTLLLHLKVWQSNFAHRSLGLLVVVVVLLLLFLFFVVVFCVLLLLLLLLSLPRTVSHF